MKLGQELLAVASNDLSGVIRLVNLLVKTKLQLDEENYELLQVRGGGGWARLNASPLLCDVSSDGGRTVWCLCFAYRIIYVPMWWIWMIKDGRYVLFRHRSNQREVKAYLCLFDCRYKQLNDCAVLLLSCV